MIAEQDGRVYFLAVHPDNGLQLYTDLLISFRTSINEVPDILSLSMSPNPVRNSLTINNPIDPDSRYQIYNVQGALIQTGRSGSMIDVDGLEAGSYYLFIQNSGQAYQSKFVKI